MGIKIGVTQKRQLYPEILRSFLPPLLCEEIDNLGYTCHIEEIRLRAGGRASLTTERGSVILNFVTRGYELGEMLAALCDYSLYAHSDTVNRGYVTIKGGIRVGICGRAAIDGGQVLGIYDISALNIRIPIMLRSLGDKVCELLKRERGRRGVLIYSPPGVGKTTLLKSVAYKMASGERPLRVALIDTRGELGYAPEFKNATIDILSGYPKGIGIEIAARTMNSELMVCDEIGDREEAQAIIAAQNCGVPLLASAHGESIGGLLRRTAIMKLHNSKVFAFYVRIERGTFGGEYKYNITSAEDADVLLQNGRSIDNRI